MASTSTSSVQKSFKYDVFLSFRGDCTHNNFVDRLYKALEQHGIETYKDDEEIEKGETIHTQLLDSIKDSRFYIIVFSKNYASSSCCLDELVKILECRKASEQTAYPVFYDVEPTEICKQSGVVGEAFKKHENEVAVRKWRGALNEAGNLVGDESKLIQVIVDDIFQKISSSKSSVDRKLIGMERRLEAFISSLELDAHDVRMIGVWGMAGGGKTTLARAVFDRISIQFDGTAFVEHVRGVSKSSLNRLQQQVLSSFLSRTNIAITSVHQGTRLMKTLLHGRKVLIVLDDVNDREQLEALAGSPDWFELGSRVIITTRDKQVLLAHGVKCIDVKLLSRAEAICLLSKNAFKRDIPIEGYEDLSGHVVKYADGLPLTIKVLGSMLYGQNELQWIDALERLKKIPLNATMEKLELSYINLEEDHKEIFLDVACLLKGWSKENAVIALESCGFFAEAGLRVLEQKSLITISNSTYGPRLEMHYHIEEMGKNIVRRLNPNEPERHSRLWIKEEIVDVLANNSGTQETKCITMFVKEPNFELLTEGLTNMKELRFLEVDSTFLGEDEVSNWNFDEDSLHLPNALRFLKWRGYPFSSLPKTFQANNLVGFEMGSGYLVQLWKDGEEKAFLKLRFLKFHYTLMRTLDLSVAPNLETLILECCFDLVELDFQVTSNLKELRIDYCDKLKKLHMPAESPNLETLRVENCSDMVELHMPAECPKLVNIDLTNLKLRTLQLGVTPNLETLRVKKCTDMVELHMPGQCPQLVDLDLSNLKLTTLYLGITPNLKTVSLKDCSDLVELQISAECPKLVNLDLSNCIQFAELPEDIGRYECLKELDITGAGISRLPESIFRVKGLRIVGSRRLLESCGFTSAIKISDNKTFCYI